MIRMTGRDVREVVNENTRSCMNSDRVLHANTRTRYKMTLRLYATSSNLPFAPSQPIADNTYPPSSRPSTTTTDTVKLAASTKPELGHSDAMSIRYDCRHTTQP